MCRRTVAAHLGIYLCFARGGGAWGRPGSYIPISSDAKKLRLFRYV